jgi:hypothetical protein
MAARYLFQTTPFEKIAIAACGPLPPPAAKKEQGIVQYGESIVTLRSNLLPSADNKKSEIELTSWRKRDL